MCLNTRAGDGDRTIIQCHSHTRRFVNNIAIFVHDEGKNDCLMNKNGKFVHAGSKNNYLMNKIGKFVHSDIGNNAITVLISILSRRHICLFPAL